MSPKRSDRGATVVLVATVLMLLFGFAALAIDAGLGYNDRRGTTNAADNAALAAAFEDCNPSGVGPEAAAAATAAANGYDNAAADTEVTTQSLPDEGEWQVTISEVNEGVFGVATPNAGDSLTVVSEAVALCDPTSFLEGMAIFAGAENCNVTELTLTASGSVDGGIHSNGQLHLSNSLTLNGEPVTYGVASSPTPPGELDEGFREYPIDIDISEYRPGGSRATGNYFSHSATIDNDWLVGQGYAVSTGGNSIEMIQSGIYYTSNTSTQAIDLNDVSAASGVTVTFVAEGQIRLNGPILQDLHGHDPIIPGGTVPLLFFSNYPGVPDLCNPSLDAVRFSANASLDNARGVIFAPFGHVQLSSASVELDGSIIAFMVRANGATLNVAYQNDPNFVPDYQVELIR